MFSWEDILLRKKKKNNIFYQLIIKAGSLQFESAFCFRSLSFNNGEMVITEKEDYLCATNFYLHDVPFEYEKQGMDRYEKLVERLTETKSTLTLEQGMDLLNYVRIVSTEPDKEGRVYSTQWSSIYNLEEKTLTMCVDKNYDESFTYSALK